MLHESVVEPFTTTSEGSTQRRCQKDSPIFKIPPELMSRIFILSVPPEFGFNSSLIMHPLPVMTTCKHWYDLAIRTPQLWSRYTIGRTISDILYLSTFRFGAVVQLDKDWPAQLPNDIRKVKPVLHLWLDRAKATPLDIKTFSFENLDLCLWDILLKKIKQWRRWEHVSPILGGMDVDGILRFWDRIDKAADLQYICSNFNMPTNQEKKNHVLGQLEKLSLKFRRSAVHLSFLTHLELSGDMIKKFLEGAWTAAPALAELTLYRPKKEDFDWITSYPPSLRQVNIGVDDDFTSFVYATTCFPSEVGFALSTTLDTFYIYLDNHYDENASEDELPRYHSVNSLIIEGWGSNETYGEVLFSSFPNITHFTLVCGVSKQPLKRLCFETSDPLPSGWTLPFCQKLQSVTLRKTEVIVPSLLEFTAYRAPPQTEVEESNRSGRVIERCLVSLIDCELRPGPDDPRPNISNVNGADLDFLGAERIVNECFSEDSITDQEEDGE